MSSEDATIIDQGPPAATEKKPDTAALSQFVKHYPKGTIIFEQNDVGSHMFFIQQGRVRITKVTQKRTQPLAILEPGSFFGEMAVVSGEPRTARADALDDCTLLEIDKDILSEFLRSHPNVAQRMIHVLAQRLRSTDELIERLLAGDPMIQVVSAMLEMVENSDEKPPYIRDIQALMVKSATDPRLLRWVLTRLKHARFIVIDDDGIRIAQLPRLRDYLNFLNVQQDLLSPK